MSAPAQANKARLRLLSFLRIPTLSFIKPDCVLLPGLALESDTAPHSLVRYVNDNGQATHLVLLFVQMAANILPVLGFWGLFQIFLVYHNNYRSVGGLVNKILLKLIYLTYISVLYCVQKCHKDFCFVQYCDVEIPYIWILIWIQKFFEIVISGISGMKPYAGYDKPDIRLDVQKALFTHTYSVHYIRFNFGKINEYLLLVMMCRIVLETQFQNKKLRFHAAIGL